MTDAYLKFLTFVLLMIATPGPANMLVMIGGAQRGVFSCMGFIIGLICGKFCLNIIFGLGFGLFLEDQPLLRDGLKIFSAVYIIWLALQSWNDRVETGLNPNPLSFFRGFIVHPISPKTWVMVTLAWSQFAPNLGTLENQLFLVTVGFGVIQLIFHTLWCVVGSKMRKAFPHSKNLTRSMLAITVATVLWALWY